MQCVVNTMAIALIDDNVVVSSHLIRAGVIIVSTVDILPAL
jgi:hypothetical protein